MQVQTLLSNLSSTSFKTRDEQEVAGYAEAMDMVFQAYEDINITENHIRQLHQTLLRHSDKDERHRGDYKKLSNHVVAIDEQGKEIGVVFETATPFDTPRKMEELVWGAFSDMEKGEQLGTQKIEKAERRISKHDVAAHNGKLGTIFLCRFPSAGDSHAQSDAPTGIAVYPNR